MENEENEINIYELKNVEIEQLEHMAFDDNDPEAQVALGYCYENGINGVFENKELAFKLYEMAAEQNNPNGIYNKGVCLGFAIGTGKERDATGWLENIRKAAEMGFAPAQNDYGWAFECARDRGFFDIKDDTLAFDWYMLSARQGHQTAIKNVVRCYEEGIGVTADRKEAEKWRNELTD